MHITRYTDYSLRVLMYVALKGEEISTIGEIAESYDISKNHLMKVVQELNLVAATGWTFAFALFTLIYWPILTRPRADGRPG